MEAAIDMAESGHLVIGTLHTKGCAETIDRIINFYEVRDQAQIKNLLSSLLKAVVSQRLLKSAKGKGLVLVPEVMLVDNTVAACIRKDKFSVSEIEDAIQGAHEKGSISLLNSLATLYVDGKLSLDQVKSQIDEKNYESLNRTIMQLNLKRNAARASKVQN
jgi:twitching motility protein PilT